MSKQSVNKYLQRQASLQETQEKCQSLNQDINEAGIHWNKNHCHNNRFGKYSAGYEIWSHPKARYISTANTTSLLPKMWLCMLHRYHEPLLPKKNGCFQLFIQLVFHWNSLNFSYIYREHIKCKPISPCKSCKFQSGHLLYHQL